MLLIGVLIEGVYIWILLIMDVLCSSAFKAKFGLNRLVNASAYLPSIFRLVIGSYFVRLFEYPVPV